MSFGDMPRILLLGDMIVAIGMRKWSIQWFDLVSCWTTQCFTFLSLVCYQFAHPGGMEGLFSLGRKYEPGTWNRLYATETSSDIATKMCG